MTMQPLTENELQVLAMLDKAQVSYSYLEVTETGLKKNILDAIYPLRKLLRETGIHDYDLQAQGVESKVTKDAELLDEYSGAPISKKISLYRPNTKKGDPRIWVTVLGQTVNPWDKVLFAVIENKISVVNLSRITVGALRGGSSRLSLHVRGVVRNVEGTVSELLESLLEISSLGFIPSSKTGSTAVGHLLEEKLGIAQNSSKDPDYKGIELKSTRSKTSTRETLFAQVPNWKRSRLKGSGEILDEFGYFRDGKRRLNCTVSTQKVNSQGLQFELRASDRELHEVYLKDDRTLDVAVWEMDLLESRLLQKHHSTFWIRAVSKRVNGIELFRFVEATHTRDPIPQQLAPMIAEGKITMDHLISRAPEAFSARERGPLFKIRESGKTQLFPPSDKYDLLELSRS